MTPEQKFLKALISFHMSETAGCEYEQKAFKQACNDYLASLDQFTDSSKKVDECVGGCVQCGCCDQFRDDTKKVEFRGCDCSMPDLFGGIISTPQIKCGNCPTCGSIGGCICKGGDA